MKRESKIEIFKPKLTRTEAKGDATTRAAREIIHAEAAAEAKKTARLRAARLAQEAQQPAPVEKKRTRTR
jgi:hypothetical protein